MVTSPYGESGEQGIPVDGVRGPDDGGLGDGGLIDGGLRCASTAETAKATKRADLIAFLLVAIILQLVELEAQL